MYDRILKFFNDNDHFAKENGMVITRLGEGTSEAVLTATDRHINGMGIIMGGALFTLSDFAFAAAIHTFGFRAVGMNTTTAFLKPGKGVPGAKFTARATLPEYITMGMLDSYVDWASKQTGYVELSNVNDVAVSGELLGIDTQPLPCSEMLRFAEGEGLPPLAA